MQRPSWSSALIIFETIAVSFSFQRQASLLACGVNHGHPFFHCFQDYCSLFCLPDTSESVGMQRQSCSSIFFIVFKTIAFFFAFQRQESPLACRDNHGYPFFRCFQDYCSLLCLPETSESVGMQRQLWSSYISKTKMSSKGDNAFIYTFEDNNVFISKTSMSFVLHRTQRPLFLCF